ncbi:hypothetical protein Dda_8104 [Drechslerella dactyloides]|uniref:Putative lipoate-protein ligase A n=1 Tax=Drechslerella dactyloides TaxID=74499 RepID=A0AAD6IVL1_DREDA|nr:hypothetical protein Dda_8104 [Drechslerella dactyloides]
MSPSRGLRPPRIVSAVLSRLQSRPQCRHHAVHAPRPLPTTTRNTNRAPGPADAPPITQLRLSPRRLHVYRSSSADPFFNLSVEDYLLRHSPADSTILFTYTNEPCVVIGRNQNPWAEINMPLLRHMQQTPETYVHFVRRRSGGGTVYHDLGNLCWSVVMPGKAFDRDKYAHVVVCALQSLGVRDAAVNERHDIVLRPDVSTDGKKVSGSAYKIIRERAYHHATLLLSSNLENVSKLLASPLRPFLETAGVASVRSSVTNIGVNKEQLIDAIEAEFLRTHEDSAGEVSRVTLDQEETLQVRTYIKEGMEELKSVKWLYSQTPRFTLTLPDKQPLPELHGQPSLTPALPEHARFILFAERGQIMNATVSTSPDPDFAFVQSHESHVRLLRTPFEGASIAATLAQVNSLDAAAAQPVTRWLEAAVGEWAGGEWNPNAIKDGQPTMRKRALRRLLRKDHYASKLSADKKKLELELQWRQGQLARRKRTTRKGADGKPLVRLVTPSLVRHVGATEFPRFRTRPVAARKYPGSPPDKPKSVKGKTAVKTKAATRDKPGASNES